MKWLMITGAGKTTKLRLLESTLEALGVDATRLSDASPKGLRWIAEHGPRVLLVDDIDFKDPFRRRLIRELDQTDITVIATSREIPEAIVDQCEILHHEQWAQWWKEVKVLGGR